VGPFSQFPADSGSNEYERRRTQLADRARAITALAGDSSAPEAYLQPFPELPSLDAAAPPPLPAPRLTSEERADLLTSKDARASAIAKLIKLFSG
jgi:hypothetical protein